MKSIVAAGFAVAALWGAWISQEFIFHWFDIPWKGEPLGQLGDTFGALNALFSALAFIAVLFTLKQQRDDLNRQQEQIFRTEKDQHVQRFEQTFYELLRLLREARNDVEFRYSKEYLQDRAPTDRNSGVRVEGTESFKRASTEMRHWIELAHQADGDVPADTVAKLYLKHVHSRYESTFAPYYRLLYTLLLRIKEDPVLTQHQKHRYGNLLRSQLTSHEVALCCYNGLAAISGSFKDLIVDFRLAKYLPDQFGRKRLELYYPASSFAGRD
ncbi:putative phage abortive infection protein [Rhizobium laguerreae]|uniref:putative phage abortive infection protein n=1 Tax=Rhizobium laguerreae TaxID=1076926 RepID=UPI001C9150CA|nr:putative phage abortive infection protein [Rhizobium laguerreae]MBY3315075.1 hypothetical protein [Rhizobium laguerreae]